MTKTQQLDELFAVWRRHRPCYTTFVEDGIVNEALWHAAPRQVLFVLKDFNGKESVDARQVFDGVTGQENGPGSS